MKGWSFNIFLKLEIINTWQNPVRLTGRGFVSIVSFLCQGVLFLEQEVLWLAFKHCNCKKNVGFPDWRFGRGRFLLLLCYEKETGLLSPRRQKVTILMSFYYALTFTLLNCLAEIYFKKLKVLMCVFGLLNMWRHILNLIYSGKIRFVLREIFEG